MTSTSARPDDKAAPKTPAQAPARAKRSRYRYVAPATQKGTPEARRTAALVLDVLAGARRPADAAGELGTSTMRYYVLESRALAGLIAGCEPKAPGHPADPGRQVLTLTREIERLRQSAARYQALARAAQRALGVAPPKPDAPATGGADGRKRRRRPAVRALRVAGELRRGAASAPPAAGAAPPAEPALAAKAAP